jgi:hypothetical protein
MSLSPIKIAFRRLRKKGSANIKVENKLPKQYSKIRAQKAGFLALKANIRCLSANR